MLDYHITTDKIKKPWMHEYDLVSFRRNSFGSLSNTGIILKIRSETI